MHEHVCMYVRTYIRMYVCIYVYMYVMYMRVCVYVYVCLPHVLYYICVSYSLLYAFSAITCFNIRCNKHSNESPTVKEDTSPFISAAGE